MESVVWGVRGQLRVNRVTLVVNRRFRSTRSTDIIRLARLVPYSEMNAALPDQPADAAHCRLASLILILAHCPKIVFGVLEVILRHDPVPGQSFGAGQGRIAFIASLEILKVHRLWADKPGRLIWGAPYAVFNLAESFSEHS